MHQPVQTPAASPGLPPHRPKGMPYGVLWWRRLVVFAPALIITAMAGVLFGDLLWRWYSFFNGALAFLLFLFVVLFGLLAFGAMTALSGFLWGRSGGAKVTLTSGLTDEDLARPFSRTAVVYPVYNENPEEIYERVRTVYLSIQKTRRTDDFDFFVLSDSTNPDNWAKEEFAWARLCAEFHAFGRIFYRRRKDNVNRKAGNIADFCQTWGGRYAYMVVMDADSVMAGSDIVRMVALMEKHPRVGLLQTAPRLINGESLYGRIQQFAFRFYGDLFTAGLNLWQGPDGNYWGHNAVIRLTPFIDYCALPDLPGREPFGGKILSHDFVEAALMRRVDWEVWLLWDIGGTYEEGPQSLIDNAKRDRRWLQGNLQHTWLLFAAGLRQMSRLHLFLGIMGYLASTLWFLFLLVSTMVEINIKNIGLSIVPGESNIPPLMHLTVMQQGQILFGATLVLLFLPKVLAFLQCLMSPGRLRSFGGLPSVVSGIVVETIYSALTAPVVMLFHTHFFICLLLGMKVEWVTQQRGAVGTGWKEAFHTHGNQSVLALIWLTVAFIFKPILALWLIPVMGPALIAVPLSVWSSRPGPGLALKNLRILSTPEELNPPAEYVEMARRMADEETVLSGRFDREATREGITRAIVDPYVNAVHVSLMEREASEGSAMNQQARDICERLMAHGPQAVDEASMRLIASDPDIMVELHRKIWITPFAELAPWWQHAIERYRRTV